MTSLLISCVILSLQTAGRKMLMR